jgi:hypothetical protein
MRIESTVRQTRAYDDASTLTQTSAASAAASRTAALPVSVRRKVRNGVSRLRDHAVRLGAAAFPAASRCSGASVMDDPQSNGTIEQSVIPIFIARPSLSILRSAAATGESPCAPHPARADLRTYFDRPRFNAPSLWPNCTACIASENAVRR